MTPPETHEQIAERLVDDWKHRYGPCPHGPKTRMRECEDCLAEAIAAALQAAARANDQQVAMLKTQLAEARALPVFMRLDVADTDSDTSPPIAITNPPNAPTAQKAEQERDQQERFKHAANLRADRAEQEREDLRLDLDKAQQERDEAQRAKYGTPCRCETWIAACGEAEDRADAAEERARQAAAEERRQIEDAIALLMPLRLPEPYGGLLPGAISVQDVLLIIRARSTSGAQEGER